MTPRFVALAVVVLVSACQGAAGARPSPTPSPRPVPATARPHVDAILADAQVGLPRTGGLDHIGVLEAAHTQLNQAAALDLYRSWGWVDQATRVWALGSQGSEEWLLLTVRQDGARRAFTFYSDQRAAATAQAGPCGAAANALDECAEWQSESGTTILGRRGPFVFQLTARGADADRLALLQAQKLT